MQLIVLGSGTAVFHPQRAAAGFWLETETGSILLDCSADAPHRMAQENLDWPNLDAIWISHLHLDHCAGLAPFLFGIKWAAGIDERKQPLRIFGCQGIEKLLKAIDDAHNYKLFDQELADAMRIAKLAGPKQLLLTHLYPEWDAIDLESEAQKLWDGTTIAAHDGLRLEIEGTAKP